MKNRHPNQRRIVVHKDTVKKDDLFLMLNLNSLYAASEYLDTDGSFKLYLYLCANKDKYDFFFSSTDFCEKMNIGMSTYRRAFNKLVECGFLVQSQEGVNNWDFYEKPQSSCQNDSVKMNLSEWTYQNDTTKMILPKWTYQNDSIKMTGSDIKNEEKSVKNEENNDNEIVDPVKMNGWSCQNDTLDPVKMNGEIVYNSINNIYTNNNSYSESLFVEDNNSFNENENEENVIVFMRKDVSDSLINECSRKLQELYSHERVECFEEWTADMCDCDAELMSGVKYLLVNDGDPRFLVGDADVSVDNQNYVLESVVKIVDDYVSKQRLASFL